MLTDIEQLQTWLAETQSRQWQLAAKIGAPAQTVNRWMRGKSKISPAYRRVLKALKVL